MGLALQIAQIIALGLSMWDQATKDEQERTGKTAAELLDHALAGTLENEQYGARLKAKFEALESQGN